MTDLQCYLASTSPRRREILNQLGLHFDVLDIDVPEEIGASELAEDYVRRVALDKARAGWLHPARVKSCPVIGADTEVLFNQQIMGKPRDKQHAVDILSGLSGQTHQVITAVAVVCEGIEKVLVNTNRVTFRQLSLDEIEAYWETGEPADKAGAYAIQGMGGLFIPHLEGSFSGVMGLPVYEATELLAEFGVYVLDMKK